MNLVKKQSIVALQTDIVWENKDANHLVWERLLTQVQPAPETLVVLPEMAASGFSSNLELTAENTNGSSSESVCSRLAALWKIYIICGLVRRTSPDRGLNQSVVFAPDGSELARYTKMQLFALGGEAQVHIPGDHIVITEINGIRTALFICYDLRFPELFREAAKQGAEMIVVIANWPIKRVDHWITLLQARAIENQVWIVGVNRSGNDPHHIYPGQSLMVDCHGVVQTKPTSEEGFLLAQFDIEEQRSWRKEFPALQDRRF